MKSVYILGHTGFIGGKILTELSRVFPNVQGIPLRHSLHQFDEMFARLKLDSSDIVINAAGAASDSICAKDFTQALLINTEIPSRLASLQKTRQFRIIHLSSSFVFSGDEVMNKPLGGCRPRNFYGLSKKLAEDVLLQNKIHDTMIVRTSLVCGTSGPQKRHTKTNYDTAGELQLFDDEYHQPCHVDNLAALVAELVGVSRNKEPVLIHWGCEGICSRFHLGSALTNRGANIHRASRLNIPEHYNRPRHCTLSYEHNPSFIKTNRQLLDEVIQQLRKE